MATLPTPSKRGSCASSYHELIWLPPLTCVRIKSASMRIVWRIRGVVGLCADDARKSRLKICGLTMRLVRNAIGSPDVRTAPCVKIAWPCPRRTRSRIDWTPETSQATCNLIPAMAACASIIFRIAWVRSGITSGYCGKSSNSTEAFASVSAAER